MWVDRLQLAIAEKLEAELPAQLTAIEEEYGDGIALERPAEIWPCDKAIVNSTPAVEVWCPDSDRQFEDESALDYSHRITVVWTIAGSDEVTLDKQIKRYLYATMRILDGETFGEEWNQPIVARGCTYLVVERTEDEQPFLRVGAIEFRSGSFGR